ncbi:SagB/ThcOx family dehydrogenase [Alkaliphilus pronyensis]|uniref:SagB/ThcOx family dehydrogenase n=1 Tax=Alkaliphilus pronyensis TaxID=1482732 RepID=A0A6I0FDL1_9FIRM|nr:SagB/ThcOx family dehydrogenase [Alkaliphilus pronyensis]KAB3541001.1 SagB/ThcOx family dehydrogenase [Alkaliphilus pronyensis]
MNSIKENREFMKANFNLLENIETDQQKEITQPPLEKPADKAAPTIKLPKVKGDTIKNNDFYRVMKERRSKRKYNNQHMTIEELAFLLWATQGVDQIKGDNYATIRPAPSGGARHPFETYLLINNVKDIEPGIYRYLALSHELQLIKEDDNFEKHSLDITLGQKFVAKSAVLFIWSCIPYRSEWRYNISAHKTMLLDAGHLCQNLYLACEAIDWGTCAIAAYNQSLADTLLRLDGDDEFVVYMAAVGKV